MDQEKNVQENKEQPLIPFGWGKHRPKCLQFLNNPKSFLVAVVVYSLCQSIASVGFVSFVLPSIERRFSFSGKELGIIASSTDISALVLVVFISYYGGFGNKIKWMGGGAILVGSGLILFALPHFIVGPYKPVDARSGGLCLVTNTTINQGPPPCKVPSGGEWYYMMIFVVAQLIIGAGIAPFFSLLPAYLDENVEPKSLPVYLGIWYIFTFIGPGIGYLIGGYFLSIYVDIEQPAGQNLSPTHPSWIGAWWLGFLVFGAAILLCSVIFLGFPREMPGAKQRRLEHIRQGHLRDADGEENPRLKDILPELKKLLTNWAFIFNALGLSAALLFGGSVALFISKIFRMKFDLDPVRSGYVISLLAVIGVGLGNLLGSITVKMFPLKKTCKRAALMCFVCNALATFGPLLFLIPGCTNSNLAGISEPYHNGKSYKELADLNFANTYTDQIPTVPTVHDLSLKSQCNANCRCSTKRFFPVCGSDSVTYFDACHAGCTDEFSNKTYTNCSCIPRARTNPRPGGTAKPGYCDRKCKNVILFASLFSLVLIIRGATPVPGRTVILRCVPDNKRAFAAGIQYVLFKTLGLLPGPIIFGHLVDTTCRLWQDNCGEKGRCLDYDIENFSRIICFYGIAISFVSTVFYFISWRFCKPNVETGAHLDLVVENPGADAVLPPAPEETPL